MFALAAAANAESGQVPQSVKTARFATPRGVALDSKGNLYVADSTHSIIRKITPDGIVSTLAGADRDHGGQAVATLMELAVRRGSIIRTVLRSMPRTICM